MMVAIKKLRETDSPDMNYLAQCVFGLFIVGYPTATSSFAFVQSTWLILLVFVSCAWRGGAGCMSVWSVSDAVEFQRNW
jgi:hypothetical protein